jgi:hypothetical protein
MYMALKRKQVYLDAASDNTLKKLAKETGLSEAEHIRRAVKSYVDQCNRTRAGGVSDPLLDLIGICDDPNVPQDGALHHDHYLYGRKS